LQAAPLVAAVAEITSFGNQMKARAYYSDPEHNRSFIGRWIWIYRGKGFLELTKDKLCFTSRVLELELSPKQVQSVNFGTFARTLNRYDYTLWI
jgi:hypothetical protein